MYGWLVKYREGGKDALLAKPIPGRPRKLSGAQPHRVCALVVGSDPRQLQFEFALWTQDMVRQLTHREFEVALSAVPVGRRLGLSAQRPVWRAWQQDPETVERWKTETFPTIRFADEAGIRSDYHAGTTWAPVGCTPVVPTTAPGTRST